MLYSMKVLSGVHADGRTSEAVGARPTAGVTVALSVTVTVAVTINVEVTNKKRSR
jgi:hypothetical protein